MGGQPLGNRIPDHFPARIDAFKARSFACVIACRAASMEVPFAPSTDALPARFGFIHLIPFGARS